MRTALCVLVLTAPLSWCCHYCTDEGTVHRGPQSLNDLPRVTQLARGRERIQIQNPGDFFGFVFVYLFYYTNSVVYWLILNICFM